MLIFWSLVRNSVVLAVYLLFSVACFLTVHEHYSLVLNEVFDTWGHLGWEFEKKHIPFDLIESGFFEDDQEETFGEMTMK